MKTPTARCHQLLLVLLAAIWTLRTSVSIDCTVSTGSERTTKIVRTNTESAPRVALLSTRRAQAVVHRQNARSPVGDTNEMRYRGTPLDRFAKGRLLKHGTALVLHFHSEEGCHNANMRAHRDDDYLHITVPYLYHTFNILSYIHLFIFGNTDSSRCSTMTRYDR